MTFRKNKRKGQEVLQEIAVKVGVQSRRHRGHQSSELSEGLFRTDVFGGRQLLNNTMKRPRTQHLPESFALTVELRKFGKQTSFVNIHANCIVIVLEQLFQMRVFFLNTILETSGELQLRHNSPNFDLDLPKNVDLPVRIVL